MTDREYFNPNRLKFARQRRKFTLKNLSAKLGISSKTLSGYENGVRPPNKKDFLETLSDVLKFPVDFFFLDDIISLEESIVSFRSLARMSVAVRNAALCSGQIALEFNNWVEKRIDLPPIDVLDLRDMHPETAASALRVHWGLGERSIKNLIHLFEAKGIRVFSLNEATHDMDAYSFWVDNKSFIFLNTKKSVERSRFDAAHELGHLVLHKHGSPAGKEAEIEANRFASAFLMPEGDVRSRVNQHCSLQDIIDRKSCWLVSPGALIRRMKDLSILSEWNYRTLNMELSSLGYRKKEPNPIKQRERSKLIPMIFELLREDGVTKYDVARELGVYIKDLDELFFNLTLTEIKGSGQIDQNNSRTKPNLRLLS
ncbi:MAG TPA: XRE family transcriptional regulator [Desulfobacteraceae bacterium]|nr:XRE family transcriptional regulator [Desulfobacteraceae bacterium]